MFDVLEKNAPLSIVGVCSYRDNFPAFRNTGYLRKLMMGIFVSLLKGM